MMDTIDRAIINALQGGFPVTDSPFAEAAAKMDMDENTLITRIDSMLSSGVLSRFGPLFDADAMGGAVTLCAMEVPDVDFEDVTEVVNGYREVAHNYERQHKLNMWFVVSAESRDTIDTVLVDIQNRTGLTVHDMPKQEEFFVGLKLEV
jgi:siroheme decarboxylase